MPDEQRARFAGNIERESERLQQMIERLLNLARVEQMQALEDEQQVALAALVDELLLAHGARIDNAGLQVRQRVPVDIRLWCDPFLMRQALANLLDNALDFTPQGGALLFELEREGERVALSLFNQGQAIPEYALGRVSERFYSLPRPDTGRKSTGLGLNFVAEVMQLHGGSLAVDNVEGGVRVRLWLPVPLQLTRAARRCDLPRDEARSGSEVARAGSSRASPLTTCNLHTISTFPPEGSTQRADTGPIAHGASPMNKTLGFKLGTIAVLILLLLIPLFMIGGLIDERQSLRDDVLRDIARSSSFEQQISGPMVVVPYRKYERRWIEKDGQSVQETYTLNGNLYFLPETLDADMGVETELRARGIYQARLFHAKGSIRAVSSCPSAGASTRTTTTTASTSRSWWWASAISAASRAAWS
jgi:hypothetical protein